METCWQFQIKEKNKKDNKDTIPNVLELLPRIEEIPFSSARNFILEYEWLKNIGSAKYYYGLFLGEYLVGVVCYTTPVSPYAYTKLLGLDKEKIIIQLCRGASVFWAPKWVASKLISKSIALLSKKLEVKAIVAYADPEAGEIGVIYQACNFKYIGMTNSGGAKFYKIKGVIYHPRKVHKLFGTRKKETIEKIDPNYETLKINEKHRYIYLLGNKTENKVMHEKIKEIIKDPPKRNYN